MRTIDTITLDAVPPPSKPPAGKVRLYRDLEDGKMKVVLDTGDIVTISDYGTGKRQEADHPGR